MPILCGEISITRGNSHALDWRLRESSAQAAENCYRETIPIVICRFEENVEFSHMITRTQQSDDPRIPRQAELDTSFTCLLYRDIGNSGQNSEAISLWKDLMNTE